MSVYTENWPVRVYYEDTDHGGVVYYANYLKFMERARSEFLRSAGLELDVVGAEFGIIFAVTQANIRYLTPAIFNDMLRVETAITTLRGARIIFKQRIFRQADQKILTDADIHLACVGNNGKVKRIPNSIATVLNSQIRS